jgi:hypothetical protein
MPRGHSGRMQRAKHAVRSMFHPMGATIKIIKVPAQNTELNRSQLFPFLDSIRIVVKEKLYYKILEFINE